MTSSKSSSKYVFQGLLALIRLLRPKFYNRLTWVVVISGIAMMGTSLWEALARGLITKHFEVPLCDSDYTAYGLALVVFGLIYHLATTRLYELLAAEENREIAQRTSAHDESKFNQADALLREAHLWIFLENLENDHSYSTDQWDSIEHFAQFLSANGNQFLTDSLSSATQFLLLRWRELSHFISFKFFIYPTGQQPPYRLCMTPELNMDRDGSGSHAEKARYGQLTEELNLHIANMRSAYRAYRNAAKQSLYL